MPKHKSLGRGLSSLIPPKTLEKNLWGKEAVLGPKEKVIDIEVDKIQPNPFQPRKTFEGSSQGDLVSSIRTYGIIQPLIISETPKGYQLISGERRLRAAKKLDLKKIPAIIRSVSEQEKLELSLIENVQREDLNPMEKAWGFKKLLDEFDLTQDKLGQRVGQSRVSVTNSLRLLTLSPDIQKALIEGKITEGHAKVLLGIKSDKEREKLFKDILRNNLSVRAADRTRKVSVKKHFRRLKDPNLETQEQKLREILGTKVSINKHGRKGNIMIEFYSEEELREIIKKITK